MPSPTPLSSRLVMSPALTLQTPPCRRCHHQLTTRSPSPPPPSPLLPPPPADAVASAAVASPSPSPSSEPLPPPPPPQPYPRDAAAIPTGETGERACREAAAPARAGVAATPSADGVGPGGVATEDAVHGQATRHLMGACEMLHLQPPQSERQRPVVQQTKDRPRSLPPPPLLHTQGCGGDAVHE